MISDMIELYYYIIMELYNSSRALESMILDRNTIIDDVLHHYMYHTTINSVVVQVSLLVEWYHKPLSYHMMISVSYDIFDSTRLSSTPVPTSVLLSAAANRSLVP